MRARYFVAQQQSFAAATNLSKLGILFVFLVVIDRLGF